MAITNRHPSAMVRGANRRLRYNHAGGEVNDGLTKRRTTEAGMISGNAGIPQQVAGTQQVTGGPTYSAAAAQACRQGNLDIGLALLQQQRQTEQDRRQAEASDVALQTAREGLREKFVSRMAGI